jgi:hypothetical protein
MKKTEFDPQTFPLEADLSRADVRVLYNFCCDKEVVEFGCGGSTVFLAKIARRVMSYDTSRDWIMRTKIRLEKEIAHNCKGIDLYSSVPDKLPQADVYFIDGADKLRPLWVAAAIDRELAPIIIVHDTRRAVTMNSIGPIFVHPRTLKLRSVEYHADGSNMMVIRAGEALKYEDWNVTEPENRLPSLPPIR